MIPHCRNETLQIALVKIRIPASIGTDALSGIGRTLSQLSKLGMSSAIVIDDTRTSNYENEGKKQTLRDIRDQAMLVVNALENTGGLRAQCIDQAFELPPEETSNNAGYRFEQLTRVSIGYHNLIHSTLIRGIVPVICPVALKLSRSPSYMPVSANDVVLALVTRFSNRRRDLDRNADPTQEESQVTIQLERISVDRIIILDPLGGIPSAARHDYCHVYINLQQEYVGIKA